MIDSVFIPTTNNGANQRVNMADLALMAWQAQDYAEQQSRYEALRDWYNGVHNVPLTTRQQQYLERDSHFKFAINYLSLPVKLCTERLTVEGFDGPDGIGGEGGLIDEWWTSGRMDSVQNQVHRAAIRDGDTYVLVEWDDENGRPVFSHEPAYDGTEGLKVHYLSNLKREMTMASKVWSESRFDDRGTVQTVQRLNLYLPDMIKKYISTGKGWQPYQPNGEAWPIPWPIGRIPVVHFRWRDDGGNWGQSELEDLITIQELINKTVLDELEAADASAFQRLIVTGMSAPDDAVSFSINDILFLSGADTGVTIVAPGDLGQLRDQVKALIDRLAQISQIPLPYFQTTGQVASDATQQANEGLLVAKVASESVALGNAWEDVMYIALKLNQEYGDGRDLARGENIECQWADFERVDRLALEERRANITSVLVNAGVSLTGALALPALGYTEEEQAAMSQTDVVTGISQ